jgi:hypothetical protein
MRPTLTGMTHLSQYMAETYPNTLPLRRSIRDACGPIRFTPGTSRDGGPAGSAFDMLVTLTVQPDRVPLDRRRRCCGVADRPSLPLSSSSVPRPV